MGLLDALAAAWNDPAPNGLVSMVQGIGAERNAITRAGDLRRQMGVSPTLTGDPRTDAVLRAIDEALRIGPK